MTTPSSAENSTFHGELARHMARWEPGTGGTFLLFHGTGGDENDLFPLGRALQARWSLLGVRGQVMENGMPRFFRRLQEGVFDQADMEQRTTNLAAFIEAAQSMWLRDRGPVVALGYSNGANIISSLLFRYGPVVDAAILLRPMIPFEPPAINLLGLPVLLHGGASDMMSPPHHLEELTNLYRRLQAKPQMNILPTGHGLHQGDLMKAAEWLQGLFGKVV